MRIALSAVALLALWIPAAAQGLPSGFSYQTLSDNEIDRACNMAFLPDGRLLITERNTGRIRVFANGQLAPNAWATVATVSDPSTEQGLLGIAVDPGFLTNGYVYVYFTTPNRTENRVGRFRDVGGVGTDLTILTAPGQIPTGNIHNGGRMCFGLDGKLYIATGDIGQASQANSFVTPAGKILRYSVPNLTIPADNPIPYSSFYSYGHRNIFGIVAHPITGAVFASENGWMTTDEVNLVQPGGDHGWPRHEGNEATPDPTAVDPWVTFQPVVGPTGCAFYTGVNYPASYANSFFLVENNRNRVRHFILDATHRQLVSQSIFQPQQVGAGLDIVDGPDGNLWYLSNDTPGLRGADEIGRYVHANAPFPAANLGAVSRCILGGSMTAGLTGRNGDVFASWIALRQFTSPAPTPYGDQWVPIDFVVGVAVVTGDDRAYQAWSIPNDRTLIGATVSLQALRIPPQGPATLTNQASLRVR